MSESVDKLSENEYFFKLEVDSHYTNIGVNSFNNELFFIENEDNEKEINKAVLINFKSTSQDTKRKEEENIDNNKRLFINLASNFDNSIKEKEKIFISKKIPHNNNIKLFGRKRKNENSKSKHDKFSEDNIINKIKTNFFAFLINIINMNLLFKSYEIKKLRTKFIANLKKNENETLFKKKLLTVFLEESISTKYSKFTPCQNKNMILKILKENKEINVIKILNLTLKELFIIFRRKLNDNIEITDFLKEKIEGLDLLENNKYKDFDFFINNLEKKNDMEKLKFIEYAQKLKELCLGYEKWFAKKVPRLKPKVKKRKL